MKINFFYPKSSLAKGVFAVFAFAAFFAGTVFIFGRQTPEEKLQAQIEKVVPLTDEEKILVAQKLQELSRDSDQDGLKDWEEIIYRTDASNADTDGDGTKDGEEIKQNRNPLVKGPNDAGEQARQEALVAEDEQKFKNNRTYDFLKKIAGAIGPQLAPDGQITKEELNSAAYQELTEEITNLQDQTPKELLPITITKADLKISPQNDFASVKKYFNAVNDVYQKTFWALKEDDLLILNGAFENNDFSGLKKIDEIVSAFGSSFKEVKKIPVPDGYEDFAIKELNYLALGKFIVENFRYADQDPLNTLYMVKARVNQMLATREFHQQTGKELAQKGIVFEPKESAYLLFQ